MKKEKIISALAAMVFIIGGFSAFYLSVVKGFSGQNLFGEFSIVACIIIIIYISANHRNMFFSSLFWSVIFIYFSLIFVPHIFVLIEDMRPLADFGKPGILEESKYYLRSSVFSIVLTSTLFLASAFGLSALLINRRPGEASNIPSATVVAAGVIGGLAVLVHSSRLLGLPGFNDVTVPVMALALSVTCYAGGRFFWMFLVIVISSLFFVGEMKITVAFLFIPLVSLLLRAKSLFGLWKWGALITLAAVFVPLVIISARLDTVVGEIGNKEFIIRTKLLTRQYETASCFLNLVKKEWDNSDKSKFFSLYTSFIPRVLWKDKPIVSDGRFYASYYCGVKIDPLVPHSASLTIMGEPIRQAGRFGWVMGLLTLVVIGHLTAFGASRGGLPLVVSTALWPWYADVEQNFAMYISRLGKSALVMIVICIGLGLMARWWEINQARRQPQVLNSDVPE